MRKTLALISALVLLSPLVGHAQDGRAALENVAKAMGATALKSITYTGSGQTFLVGQSVVPGAPWPPLTLKSQTRAINYETPRSGSSRSWSGPPTCGGAGRSRLVTRGRSSW